MELSLFCMVELVLVMTSFSGYKFVLLSSRVDASKQGTKPFISHTRRSSFTVLLRTV